MAAGLRIYTDDYDGGLPCCGAWRQVVLQTSHPAFPLVCPDTKAEASEPERFPSTGSRIAGYAYNFRLGGLPIHAPEFTPIPLRIDRVRFPAMTVTFCDSKVQLVLRDRPDITTPSTGRWEEGGRRHDGGANYAFADGHVGWYRPESVDGAQTAWRPDGLRPTFKPR
jgi:prepilin-type processing-associated H-X9-DG protein